MPADKDLNELVHLLVGNNGLPAVLEAVAASCDRWANYAYDDHEKLGEVADLNGKAWENAAADVRAIRVSEDLS
jgi:hypothetical protein